MSRFFLTVAATSAIVVVAIAAPLYVSSRTSTPSVEIEPAPFTSKAGQIRTVPDVAAKQREAETDAVASALRKLYTRAFVPSASEISQASPRPGLVTRMSPSMTDQARKALAKARDVFDVSPLQVIVGEVAFSGLITFAEGEPVESLLEVDFAARAVVPQSATLVKVRQLGTVVMTRRSAGWLLDGFDLHLETRVLPSPSP